MSVNVYKDYWAIYGQTPEHCAQETFEACNVNEWAAKEKWVDGLNPIYLRRISADSAIA